MEQFDIVKLIEDNPITKLSKDYNIKLLEKIKEQFSNFEQQLFLSSFYCYLNYNSKNDFVVDLDTIWKWLGFSQKVNAKTLLEKQFTLDKDYVKSSLLLQQKQTVHIKGGHNKEIYLLTVNAFKKFCLKAGTKKADEIHDYYIKLEELIQDVIKEDCCELKSLLTNVTNNLEKEKEELKEKTLLEQFPNNTQCIYVGLIDNKTNLTNETVIKFGQSNNLNERIKTHKKTYENFRLFNAFKVKNKIEIENCIKKHPLLKSRLRILTINDIAYRELIALDNEEFTIDKVETLIKDVIRENEYNVENYNLLLKKNDELQEEIYKLKDKIEEQSKLIETLNLSLENLNKNKKIIIERANKRLKDISEKTPEKIKEYRKKAYEKRKNKILEKNNLNNEPLNTI